MRPSFDTQSQIDELHAKIDAARVAHVVPLEMRLKHLLANQDKIAGETGMEAYRRLRRYRIREGMREVRYRLTGKRSKTAGKISARNKLLLAAIEVIWNDCDVFDKPLSFVEELWRSGSPGVELSVKRLAASIKRSPTQARQVLRALERRGWILRYEVPGKKCRFTVTLPLAQPYIDKLEEAMEVRCVHFYDTRRGLEIATGMQWDDYLESACVQLAGLTEAEVNPSSPRLRQSTLPPGSSTRPPRPKIGSPEGGLTPTENGP